MLIVSSLRSGLSGPGDSEMSAAGSRSALEHRERVRRARKERRGFRECAHVVDAAAQSCDEPIAVGGGHQRVC